MALLVWNDRYSVGDPAVDHEHRELIDLINHVHAELMAGEPKDDIERFLGEVNRGVAAHFALEETQMRAHGYDQYAVHKADHERLLDEIRDIMEETHDADLATANAALADRLDRWFGNHFATHDARLHGKLGSHHPEE